MSFEIDWDAVSSEVWDGVAPVASDCGDDAPSSTDLSLATTLQQHFGYSTFRPQQRELIEACLAGRDSLALMATGAGKSICYQLPPLHVRRTDRSRRTAMTIVVSPLISLMEDQVLALQQRGVAAEQLSSSQTDPHALRRALAGELALVYLSPERLKGLMPELRRFHARHGIISVAIDEAHCVSEWGHDFRPSYRELSFIREQLPEVPLMLLTATATRAVERDILASLRIASGVSSRLFTARSSFNRPNLFYSVRLKGGSGGGSSARGTPYADVIRLLRGTYAANDRALYTHYIYTYIDHIRRNQIVL